MSAIIYMENFSKKNPHDGDRRREKLIKVKVCRYISLFFHPACFLFTNKVENKKFIFILNSTAKICFTHSVADFGGSKWGQFIVIILPVCPIYWRSSFFYMGSTFYMRFRLVDVLFKQKTVQNGFKGRSINNLFG